MPPPATTAAPRVEPPSFEQLLDVHAGRRTFASLIDPARGVFLAEAHTDFGNDDPPADADGWVRRAKLVCTNTTELDRTLRALDGIASGELPPDGYGCNGGRCWIQGQMEYALSYTFRFRASRLDAVIGVEGSLPHATQDELTESLLARQPARRCPE